jgi:hypothetical protein
MAPKGSKSPDEGLLPWLFVIMRPPPPYLRERDPQACGEGSSMALCDHAVATDGLEGAVLTGAGKALRGRFSCVEKDVNQLRQYCTQKEINVNTRILEVEPPAWVPDRGLLLESLSVRQVAGDLTTGGGTDPVGGESNLGRSSAKATRNQRPKQKVPHYDVPSITDELGQDQARDILGKITRFLGEFLMYAVPQLLLALSCTCIVLVSR